MSLNTSGDGEAGTATARLSSLFGREAREGNSSIFVGAAFEVMRGQGPGSKGHMAIETRSVSRAIAFLERQGVEFDCGSVREVDGRLRSIYLKEEIGGFTVHLLQKG